MLANWLLSFLNRLSRRSHKGLHSTIDQLHFSTSRPIYNYAQHENPHRRQGKWNYHHHSRGNQVRCFCCCFYCCFDSSTVFNFWMRLRIPTRKRVRPSVRPCHNCKNRRNMLIKMFWDPGKGEQLLLLLLPNGSRICWSCIRPCFVIVRVIVVCFLFIVLIIV